LELAIRNGLRNNEVMVTRLLVKFALLFAVAVPFSTAQTPKSVTYLRISSEIVEQRVQPPEPSQDWLAVLRQQYTKAGIQHDQISEQDVPGSSQKMLVCTLKGRGDSVLVVSASLTRPKDDDAASIGWASLAMLPLLAESLNSVSTESSILLIAFPDEERRHPGPARYVRQLSEMQRKKIKAAVEISGIGRGRTSIEAKREDRPLADWLATAAFALQLPAPWPASEYDTVNFAGAKAFRSAAVPAVTVSSQPQRIPQSFSYSYKLLNKLIPYEYYNTYQLLCVFLLDLDRAPRGVSPESAITPAASTPSKARWPAFTIDEANAMIVGQINDERSRHGSRTLTWLGVSELQGLTCAMAQAGKLDDEPFRGLLRQKQLSGIIAVFSGDYPSLLPDQVQGFKIGRYERIAVATCVGPPQTDKGPTYWIAALAY
jgi:hypothetical protein